MSHKVEVVCEPQEGRYYYTTTWTEKIDNGERYFSTNPLRYVGKYIGGRIEGWGEKMQEWQHFINDRGEEVVVTCNDTTAFYEVNKTETISDMQEYRDTLFCGACKEKGHRCPNENLRQAYFDSKQAQVKQAQVNKEIYVVRSPVANKYYEATFWTRRVGNWPNEQHYTSIDTPREYVGKYIKHKQCGYGDSADHWAICLKDGKEHEVEFDYDGKRAFYEVDPRPE